MLWIILLLIPLVVFLVLIALNFTTPEKKLERKIEHLYNLSSEQFHREMGVLLGPSIIDGNLIEDLQNGEEIFPAMIAAIESARQTILFETYIYWSGEIGNRFAKALAEKARSGVRVHVLIDWVGGLKMEQELLDIMEEAGCAVHKYRPLRWYQITRLNNRTHRKLLIVDGKIAFTGGVGIADQWQGRAQDPDHWRDIHFRVQGPVVSQFQAAFNDNWIKTTGIVLHGKQYFPPQTEQGGQRAHLFISSPAGGSESMHLMYLLSIAAAEKTIDLQAAYFVPDSLISQALKTACKRGVRVRVLLPGRHIDSELARLASKSSWGPLLEAGVQIYEYAPTMLHSKMLIIDEEMVSVGSTNFDPRSFQLNDEASLNIYDHEFAHKMTEVFEQDIQHGVEYSYAMWAGRPWREKLLEKFVHPIRSQI